MQAGASLAGAPGAWYLPHTAITPLLRPLQLTVCPISDLSPGKPYVVSGVAYTYKNSPYPVASIRSDAAKFNTPQWP